jgi:glutathione S-transferase
MSEIVIYGVPGSPFVRTVQMGLDEKRAPYRLDALQPAGSKSQDHLNRHPFGRVPVIDHDDYRLYETQAILRYLDASFPEPSWQPREPRAIGRMNQIIGINDWYFFPKVAAVIVFNRIVGPVLMGRTPDEAAIAEAMPMARICIGELNRLLGDQRFMVGDRLSIADLMLAPQLDFFADTREGAELMRATALAGWLARMNERPSMQRTQRPENLRQAA